MRCPYCGGLNQERAAFCVSCGRDLTRQPAQPGSYQPARPGSAPQNRPVNPPNQPTYRAPNTQRTYQPAPSRQPAQPQQATASGRRQAQTSAWPAPEPVDPLRSTPAPEPEPPVPFPPRTLDQFNLLLASGAQPYTLIESTLGDGKRKLVRIAYPGCAGWQQAATLLKALREQQDEKCNTIIIQGVLPQQTHVYAFTNGQLQFDRAVRLGGQVSNRYVVETDNGFASDSTRFVLNE